MTEDYNRIWPFIRKHNVAVAYGLMIGSILIGAGLVIWSVQYGLVMGILGGVIAVTIMWVCWQIAPVIRWAEDEDWGHYEV